MNSHSLFPFQREAVAQLMAGKRIIISDTGSGKSIMAMVFAERKCKETGKRKVLVVTTASKCKARTERGLNDFEDEAQKFCSPAFVETLRSGLTLISWHKLASWTDAHQAEVGDYVVIWDELQKAGSGVGSKMGRAFLKITKKNPDWAGFTGTPGDTYLKLYPYFVATGLVRNKTSFLAEYANVQTFKGYPEIVGWRHEDRLKAMWERISFAPDANKVLSELPEQTHRVFTFPKPRSYSTVLKTRLRAGCDPDSPSDEDFLDTSMALCSELRRLCFTKDKQEWVKDFVENAGANCIIFYNFIATGDKLAEICTKALGEGGRVWRIDGKHHEIPTAESVGPRDIVLCQWQSGSEGLNVHFAHLWVSVEACYSYSTSIQARGRIRRIGQKHPQLYYYLKTEGTIEDSIYECLHNKSDFAEDVWCLGKGIKLKGEDGNTNQRMV